MGHHNVGHIVVNGADDENQPVLEEPGVDVVRTFAASRLFDDHGNQVQGTLVHVAELPVVASF